MKKNAMFISGGGTKGPFLLGAALRILNSTKVQHFVGVSIGSVISLTLAMMSKFPHLRNEAINMFLTFDKQTIFKEDINSFRGKVQILWRLIKGEYYIFDDSNLRDTIKSILTEEMFNDWKNDDDTPDAYAVIVDPETNGESEEIEIQVRLKECEYNEAIEAVMASTSIPPFVKPKEYRGRKFYDGGLQSHNGSYEFIIKHWKSLGRTFSIYSRPFDVSQLEWELPEVKFGRIVNILKVLNRVQELLLYRISKDDEELTANFLKGRGVKHTTIYAPEKLADDPYQVTIEQNKDLYHKGVEQAIKAGF